VLLAFNDFVKQKLQNTLLARMLIIL